MKTVGRIFDILGKYGWSATLIILAALALGFTWSSSDEIFTSIRLFDRIALMVDQNYVETVDRTKMIRAGIDGMLEKLDKYTKYLEGGDFLHLQQATDGKIEGIGIYLEYHRDTLTVTSVLEGAPGHEAGILPGDRILMIDSVATEGLNIRDVRMLMVGEAGSPIDLLVRKPYEGDYRVTAYREKVDIESIPYHGMLTEHVGYVRLARFSEKCASKLRNSIQSLKEQGMASLVLDLRENPGGLLAEAIEIASLFLPEHAAVVETRGRNGLQIASFTAYGSPVFLDGELVVLIDSKTASAAEIVAGTIQDHDRGVIIGGSSYGKGLVQQVLMVSDESALKITTSKYHLPSGRCLQNPDWSNFELLSEKERLNKSDSIFYTSQGRPVYGGEGISPDIYYDDLNSDFVEALREQTYFFDFATAFLNENEIGPEFGVNDEVMMEFKAFVENKDFEYEESERTAFTELSDNIKAPDDETEKAMAVIDQKISAREQWQFESNYPAISETLERTIITQKFGERKWYETHIDSQPLVVRAIELLSSDQEYIAVFSQR